MDSGLPRRGVRGLGFRGLSGIVLRSALFLFGLWLFGPI